MNKSFLRRMLVDKLMTAVMYVAALAAIVPLVLILAYLIVKGLPVWNLEFFTDLPQLYASGGGVGNAMVGTIIIVGLASAIGVPVGIMAGIYLAEYGDNPLGVFIRFMADVMSGIPSIIAGIFAYGLLVLIMGFNAFAGSVSLTILMVPVVARTTEEVVRLVPGSIREASLALGVPEWKTILRVVLPTALGGIVTGVLLAIARVSGETAPLIFTILGSNFWNTKVTEGAMAALPLQIYNFARTPYESVLASAWGASLILVCMILILNLVARLIFARWSGVR